MIGYYFQPIQRKLRKSLVTPLQFQAKMRVVGHINEVRGYFFPREIPCLQLEFESSEKTKLEKILSMKLPNIAPAAIESHYRRDLFEIGCRVSAVFEQRFMRKPNRNKSYLVIISVVKIGI